MVNRNSVLNQFFIFLALNLNIGWKNDSFSRKLCTLFSDKLFKEGGLKSDFTLYVMSTG